jgi:hypothetical protein
MHARLMPTTVTTARATRSLLALAICDVLRHGGHDFFPARVCQPSGGNQSSGEKMQAAQGLPSGFGPIIILIVLAASLCVVYWRIVLRIVAITIITLTLFGLVLVFEELHHMFK